MKTAFETRTNAYVFNPADLVLVSDKKNPLYDPRMELPIDEGLVRNIMVNGVIEPIVITKHGDSPVVVDGRQRVRAAIEANLRLEKEGKEPVRITAVIRRGDESSLFGVSISANENRQDDTPMGRAQKCARYLNMGRTEEEAAITFGVSKQCVFSWLKLLDCSAPVRQAVEEGKIAASAAAKLANLSHEEQLTALEAALAEGARNGKRPTARAVAKTVGKAEGKLKTRKAIMRRLEEEKLSKEYRAALIWVLGDEEDEN